jgi:hypothetical protein
MQEPQSAAGEEIYPGSLSSWSGTDVIIQENGKTGAGAPNRSKAFRSRFLVPEKRIRISDPRHAPDVVDGIPVIVGR